MAKKTPSIKVVTQNCFLGRTLKQVAKLINDEQPDVCCLQEVTGSIFADKMKSLTSYDYALSKPFRSLYFGRNFHTAIFTKHPITETGNFYWKKKRRIWIDPFAGQSLWIKTTVKGKPLLAFSNYFSIVDQGMNERKEMISEVADFACKLNLPTVICGDMNTVIPHVNRKRILLKLFHRFKNPDKSLHGEIVDLNEKHFFLEAVKKFGFDEMADFTKNTWRDIFTHREFFDLKLDWMLYRNCRKLSSTLGNWIGDHRAIIGNLALE